YTTRNKTAGFSVRTVRSWPEDAIPRLQDCFSSTDWDIFKDHGTITQATKSSPSSILK
ncbi:adenylate cyclase type 2-like, partial [Clarias magur]